MAITRRSLSALALGAALTLALCSPARAMVRLYTFGDSFVDVGNADRDPDYKGAKADMLPYGSALNPPRPTGRFGNGLIFPDFLGQLPPPISPATAQPWLLLTGRRDSTLLLLSQCTMTLVPLMDSQTFL